MNRDRIYSLPRQHVGDFAFDQSVVDVFPDMISRSVPGYASILSMIEQLSARFIIPKTNVYDLGCSLGAATLLMRRQAPPGCTIHAVDNAPAMIQQLKKNLLQNRAADCCEVEIHEADLSQFPMSNASFVVLNFTLQFVPAADRQSVLQNTFNAICPGGALLLSEKICLDDPAQQSLLTDLHHDFKRAHGYSGLEIAQKRTALENRLIPETLDAHLCRLRSVGFRTVVPWYQCFNFVSVLAVKSESQL